ncbi:unnamed protein product [Blepharisma stoltei]|uniref:EF-hand domain-containing protein n=1 Tax=Blepharisma stoltei TaxID=1481888 RepID=A0AAU9J9J1_9CILI|nr:unnamed protein product [Blepharisma stoltei]
MRAQTKQETFQDLDLTQEEVDYMREQFHIIDRQNIGYINIHELNGLFEAVGENPSEDKMSKIGTFIEEKGVTKVDLSTALKAWSYLKELNLKDEEEVDIDIVNTFVAMGGNIDRSGVVKKQKLIDIIKVEFGLTIDIEAMFEEAGLDVEDELNFYDFTCLLESGGSQRASRICSFISMASLG